jgi:hypothetical protein
VSSDLQELREAALVAARTALAAALRRLRAVHAAALVAWQAHGSTLLRRWYVQALAAAALAVGVLTALANLWAVPYVNRSVLPAAAAAASRALDREVRALRTAFRLCACVRRTRRCRGMHEVHAVHRCYQSWP